MLDLSLFAEAVEDRERTEYKILAALKEAKAQFNDHRLYPHLRNLVSVHRDLEECLSAGEDLRNEESGELSGIDPAEKELVFEWPELEDENVVETVQGLMKWALPKIKDAIETGASVYDEIEEGLSVNTIGAIPTYRAEGYVVVPDDEKRHVYRYEVGMVASKPQPERALRADRQKTVDGDKDPADVKEEMSETRPDLPAPVMYHIVPESPVPFEPTLWPIAKRTLLRLLTADPDIYERQPGRGD